MENGMLMTPIKGIALAISLTLMMVASLVEAASLGPISEETPPAVCDPGYFIEEVHCTGGYCDNIRISCRQLPDAALGRAAAEIAGIIPLLPDSRVAEVTATTSPSTAWKWPTSLASVVVGKWDRSQKNEGEG